MNSVCYNCCKQEVCRFKDEAESLDVSIKEQIEEWTDCRCKENPFTVRLTCKYFTSGENIVF